MAPQAAPAAAPAADGYLQGISDESFEVLQHFGPEAPAKLNAYACQAEEAVLEALQHQQAQAQRIAQLEQYASDVQDVMAAAQSRMNAMMRILSNPDILADYTDKFFGPEGPAYTPTPSEQARESLAQGMQQVEGDQPLMPRAGDPMDPAMNGDMAAYQQQLAYQQQEQAEAEEASQEAELERRWQLAQQQGQPAPGFQRPQMGGIPAATAPNGNPQAFWGSFSQTMLSNPTEAWKLIDQASPDVLRRKVLVVE